jgi:hypothetical protein
MQPIYYPGFTSGGGIGEAGGTILTLILLFLTPWGTATFWLTLVALLGLIGMQAVYWLLTHPANKFWLQNDQLSGLGAGFFSFGTHKEDTRPVSWTEWSERDRPPIHADGYDPTAPERPGAHHRRLLRRDQGAAGPVHPDQR